MSNTRNDIAKRLGSAQPNARPGAKTRMASKDENYFTIHGITDNKEVYVHSRDTMQQAESDAPKVFDWVRSRYPNAAKVIVNIKEVVNGDKSNSKIIKTLTSGGKSYVMNFKASRPGTKAKFATPEQTMYSELFNFWSDRKTNQASHIPALQALIRKARAMPNWKPLSARVGNKPSLHDLADTQEDSINKIKSSRPGNAAKFATPEQIKEQYKQLKELPKQRLFDMWARETLGRVHNADIKEQDKSNMAVDLIRSRFPRKDYEAAGFRIESSRPGAKAKMGIIDRIGRAATALTASPKDPSSAEYRTDLSGAKKAAQSELGNYKFLRDKAKAQQAALDSYVTNAIKTINSAASVRDVEHYLEQLKTAVRSQQMILSASKTPFSRPGAKVKMAVVKDVKIKPGKDEDSRFFTASINGIERQGKVVKDWSRLGGWGWVAYIDGVQNSGGSQTRKTIQEAIGFASEFIKASRPGAKARFETYPSDEAEPWGQDVPRSAKDLEESIAFWTDYANRLDKGLLAYPKALSKASGYKKESLLRELEWKKSAIKKVKKIVLEYKALLAKLKSNPDMNRIDGKGRLMKLQRSVSPGAKVK